MLALLVKHCVERRFAAVLVTLLVAAYGAFAYMHTPVEAYPDVTNVQVEVVAQVAGLAPEEMERQVTIPLERALNGNPGMTQMRSESGFGLTIIWCVFEDGMDPFRARMQTGERLETAEVPESAFVRLTPDATPLGKVFYYRVVSDRHDLYELRSAQEWTIARVLKQVPGVADAMGMGGFLKEFHIEVDPAKLVSYGLTLHEVSEAIEHSNLNVGGGFQKRGDQQFMIRGVGYLNSPQDIKDIVLEVESGTPVTVGDVALVVQSYTPRQGSVGYDDEREIVEGIVLLRRGENPDEVLKGIHEKVAELNDRILPEGMRIEVMYDRSDLTGLTLETVNENLWHGFVLIVAVVWLFLRSIRGSLVVAVVIPLALLTAFGGLYLIDLPANLISMGAIDFGILVDGAVVLVESAIHEARERKPETKREMLQLIGRSAIRVARPTFYAMAVIIAALIPVFTLESVEGRIFRPLALTYSFALIGALVFSLTVVPALCAIFLRPKDAQSQDPKTLVLMRNGYGRLIAWMLRGKKAIGLAFGVALFVGGMWTAPRIGTEFLPELDEGDVFVVIEMPPSISLERGQDVLAEVRRRLKEFPEVLSTPSEQGRPEDGLDNETTNMSETFARLKPREQWRPGYDSHRLVAEMRESLSEIPGVKFNFSQPIKDRVEEAVSGVRGKVVLKAYGTDLTQMRETLLSAKDALAEVEGVVDLGLYRDATVPQLQIRLNRQALARAGITIDDAGEMVETAMAGRVVTTMWEGEKIIPIRVRLPSSEKADPERIGDLTVPTASGARVPLRELADIELADGRISIMREANSRYVALKFNVDGRDLGSVVDEAIATVDEHVTAPEGTYLVWGGEFENQQRAMGRLQIIVPIALALVFLLLYGALGSGRSAATVLLSAPFGLTGGLFGLYFFGIALSVSAAVGFIALLGQVSLAGLLVISAIDDERRAGKSIDAAIAAGAATRFRALLMTAMLAMLGLLPMAVSEAVGSETQKPFAVVIVCGMVTTLLVALFVVPVLYRLIASKRMATPENLDLDLASSPDHGAHP
ncbi:MAG: efflux RND transporter permease subunit [Deltaproteobacteria bacterium]|nr:efflux RND transporter permease subunit [Nannocystaceae bacterium]